MRLARNLTHNWRWVVAYVVIVAVGIGLYQENRRSLRTDRELLQANQDAILANCQASEELRVVMRTIMASVIGFAEREGTPDSLERAATYRRIVRETLQPVACQNNK